MTQTEATNPITQAIVDALYAVKNEQDLFDALCHFHENNLRALREMINHILEHCPNCCDHKHAESIQ